MNAPQSVVAGREEALQVIVDLVRQHQLAIEDIASALAGQGAAARQTSSAAHVLSRVLAYLGGTLVLAGIALFIGLKWDQFGPATRVLVTLGPGVAAYAFALMAMGDRRFGAVITPMLLVAAVLEPTGLVVLVNEYAPQVEPDHGALFVCAVMFTQQLLTFLARPRTTLLFTSTFFGAAGLGTLADIVGIDGELIIATLGVSLTAIAWSLQRSRHHAIAGFWYLAGSAMFLGGAFELVEDSAVEVVFFGLASGVMYLATVVRSRALLVVSVIALTGFTGYYFRDSLASAYGLMVMGMLLIGLSALALRLDRRFIRR